MSRCPSSPSASKRAVSVDADYKCFDCPEVFVVGYGMDVGHRLRELPYVGHVVRE